MSDLPTTAQIRAIAREVLAGMLPPDDASASKDAPRGGRQLVNEAAVADAARSGPKAVLVVPVDAIVTPLARDAAERYGVEIRASGPAGSEARATSAKAAGEADAEPAPDQGHGPVALGADHGGFALKEALKRHLESRRFAVVDCGTTSAESCDYPDFSARVGKAISLGEAAFGVLVDGAGIGSCMAANKVPGILAATCHDEKSAKNAREHNGANVLCLGAGFLDEPRAKAVLDAFLATGFGGGRHARRVRKIRAIEQSFLRGGAP